ncbi:MAG: transglutaminase-like cysteine peptidase [Cellvibrionaceae bacterium]
MRFLPFKASANLLSTGVFSLGFATFAAFSSAQFLEMDEKVFQFIENKYDIKARHRVEEWQNIMLTTNRKGTLSDNEKTRSANDFFNRIDWVSDQDHWGKEDYWATPIETLATNGGDCEDFSIGKYFTLSETGVDNEKIRITYVKALDYNQAHMVLAYYSSPEAEPLILDNINKTILPASKRTDLLPIYSFNGEGLWLAKARGRKLKANSQKSLPQWGEVNKRMMKELMK